MAADPTNENRHWLDTHRVDKGIVHVVIGPNAKTAVGREPPPGILPKSGALRTAPSASFGGTDKKGNRTGK
jgi:hypothetical protein